MRNDVDLTRAQVSVGSPSFTISVNPMVLFKASGFILTVSRDQPRSEEVDAAAIFQGLIDSGQNLPVRPGNGPHNIGIKLLVSSVF